MPRGRKPNKIRTEVNVEEATDETEAIKAQGTPSITTAEANSMERIKNLRELYDELLMEGINTISNLEVKIQQEELNLVQIRNKK